MQRDRALNHLAAIRRDLNRLTALEPCWATLEADDRIGSRAEWSNIVDRFAAVVQASVDTRRDDDVAAELLDVAKILCDFAPALERMQLRQPSADDLQRLGIFSAA